MQSLFYRFFELNVHFWGLEYYKEHFTFIFLSKMFISIEKTKKVPVDILKF